MKFILPLALFVVASAGHDVSSNRIRHRRNKRRLSGRVKHQHSSPRHAVLLDDVKSSPFERDNRILLALSEARQPQQQEQRKLLAKESKREKSNTASRTLQESKQSTPWPFELSDIPLDPAVTYGELENGMRYYVRPNSDPPGKLELRLHIDAGANYETEEERGIAHFLEHMMFQTTQKYPVSGELVPAIQRLGIGFGIHLNAYTNLEETVYTFSVPNTENETVSTVMGWMQDVMGGALLEEEEIEAERGVVLSELELRDSVAARIQREVWKFLFPEHLLSKRFVIGTEETILGMTKDQFVTFYEEHYVPRSATFVAVGDLNATDLEELVAAYFGGLVDSGSSSDQVDYGTATEGLGFRTNVFVDPQIVVPSVTMTNVYPSEFQPDTEANRARSMRRDMANLLVSDRLSDLSIQEGSPILSGNAGNGNAYNTARVASLAVTPQTGRWREAVGMMEQEWRRAIEYGFTQFEVDKIKFRWLSFYESLVLTKDTRDSARLADQLNSAVNGGYVVSTPEENLRLTIHALDSVTIETLTEAFRAQWNSTDISVYLTIDAIDNTVEETKVDLKNLFLSSQQVVVDPPVEEETVEFAYTDFGTPGTIVSESLLPLGGMEVRQFTLSNNVRVNMMQTDFSAGSISFRTRFGKGRLGQPKDATYLDRFADFMLTNGGLGEHTLLDLDGVLSGSSVGFSFAVSDGDFIMSGSSDRDDLALSLQYMTAHLTDPGYREETVGWWKDRIPITLDSIQFSLSSAFQFQLFPWLLGGDERFTAPTEEELLSFTSMEAMEWLAPYLMNSYMEFSIIGDFNQSSTLDLLLQTIGTLPQREPAPVEVSDEERAIHIPNPQTKSFTYESRLPQAAAYVVWEIPSFVPSSQSRDTAFQYQMEILASILSDRLREEIREELGGAYSPRAFISSSADFDYGFLIARSEGLPEEVDVFTDIILGIAADLSTGQSITEDELTRMILPQLSIIDDQASSNGYWLGVIDQSQVQPIDLQVSERRAQFYESITVDEINTLASQYLSPEVAYPLSIFPRDLSETSGDNSYVPPSQESLGGDSNDDYTAKDEQTVVVSESEEESGSCFAWLSTAIAATTIVLAINL